MDNKFWWKVVPIHSNAKMPFRAADSIGYDLYAVENGFIDPLSRVLIPLGIRGAFAPGWAGLLLDRSGMGNKGITRFAGVFDPGYREEWKVILYNSTASMYKYNAGDRIIQVVFVPAGMCEVEYGEGVVLPESERKGGLGSTGV